MRADRQASCWISGQCGQAATECVLLSIFILVPLFLFIPLIGKYIDVKHATIAQARYEVWEYTAWFDDRPPDDSGGGIATPHAGAKGLNTNQTKSLPQVRREGINYFFTDITSSSYATEARQEINPLWQDHRGDTLFSHEPEKENVVFPDEGSTPDPTSGFVNDLLTGINDVTSIFGDLLHAVGVDAQFDALNTKGYFTSDFSVSLRSLDQIFPEPGISTNKPLVMPAKSSVLARGWGASSTDNAQTEARGLVISAILEPVSDLFNSLVNPLQDMVASVNRIIGSFLPIHIDFELPHMPFFGYMDEDLAIPAEHLEGGHQTLHHESGLYYYQEGGGQ